MLNTLANHGFLPHDGKDISRDATAAALFDALHINKTLGGFLFEFAMRTNPKPNATTFSLNDLGNHNILEHDASLRHVCQASIHCRRITLTHGILLREAALTLSLGMPSHLTRASLTRPSLTGPMR
jgi:hypothetical protein